MQSYYVVSSTLLYYKQLLKFLAICHRPLYAEAEEEGRPCVIGIPMGDLTKSQSNCFVLKQVFNLYDKKNGIEMVINAQHKDRPLPKSVLPRKFEFISGAYMLNGEVVSDPSEWAPGAAGEIGEHTPPVFSLADLSPPKKTRTV